MEKSVLIELEKIFKAITIISPTTYTFAGHLINQSDQVYSIKNAKDCQNKFLLHSLQQNLYQSCYIQKFTGDIRHEKFIAMPEDHLEKALSEANSSCEHWEYGWKINKVLPTGQYIAERFGIKRYLFAGEFITNEASGIIPQTGMKVRIYFAKESLSFQTGFYFAFGETVIEQNEDYNLVRFYWNVKSSGITGLMRLITQELNYFQIPFRLKCLNNSRNYNRLDSAVLYVNKRFYKITAQLFLNLYDRIKEFLNPETPIFTKQLFPGLAIAEDPGNGESFGMNRCLILAMAIWNAYLFGLQTEQSRLNELSNACKENGVIYDLPYMNADSVNLYDFHNPKIMEFNETT